MSRKVKKVRVKQNVRRLTIKFLLSNIYLLIITILLVGSYQLYSQKNTIVPMDKVLSVDEYSYIEISKMSEKFAYYENENIGLHFVIEEEDTGEWHTYVIAIDEDEYDKYKEIVDYSYNKTTTIPNKIVVYGYPTVMNSDLKEMIINNINNFISSDSGVEITNENLEQYLTNCYLDTTKEKKDEFNILLFISLLLMFVMIVLFIFTIFDKDKIVDNINEKVDELQNKKLFRKK